jgi:N-acetylmuramoyl-L-alanine amidase
VAVAEPPPSAIRLPASTIAAVRASLQRGEAAMVPHRRTRLRVVLDPGHGGKDPGAIGLGGVLEKNVVLGVARRLAKRLEAAGHEVILTRDSDVFIPLSERTQRANAAKADLFVSIHANASPNRTASGIETYYLSNTDDRATIRLAHMENQLLHMTGEPPADSDVSWIISDMIQSYKVEESHGLARQIQASLVAEARREQRNVRDLGSKPGPFFVLVGAAMPAVLAEVAFVSHPEEARRLQDGAYQDRLAEGLLLGIGRFVENAAIAATL